jgi:hypothetical protein
MGGQFDGVDRQVDDDGDVIPSAVAEHVGRRVEPAHLTRGEPGLFVAQPERGPVQLEHGAVAS